MRIDVNALRQQVWRADVVYKEMLQYARRIGCTVIQDEIMAPDDNRARLLSQWWLEKTT